MGIFLVTPLQPFQTAVGTAFNTFTTRQDVSPKPLPVIQGGVLQIGSKIEIRARGEFSTTGTPTLSIGVYFGTVAGVITGQWEYTAAATTTTGAAWAWKLEWEGIVVGPLGTACGITGQGEVLLGTSLIAFGTTPIPIPATAAARALTSYDSTIARAWGICATWGTSSVSNSITCNTLSGNLTYGP